MKQEIAELIAQKKWSEAGEYIRNRRDAFSAEELKELEKLFMESMGAQPLDEEELLRVSGGSAVGGSGGGQLTGNIHYWCKTTSKRDDCADSVLQTSSCWFDDACTLVLNKYNDWAGWNGDLETDYPDYSSLF